LGPSSYGDPSTYASSIAGITSMLYHAQLVCSDRVLITFAQAGFGLQSS
jgi:hypothetical protein